MLSVMVVQYGHVCSSVAVFSSLQVAHGLSCTTIQSMKQISVLPALICAGFVVLDGCSSAPVEPEAVSAMKTPFDKPEMAGPPKLQEDVVVADEAFVGAVSFDAESAEAVAKLPLTVVSKTPALLKVGILLAVAPGPNNPTGFMRGVEAISASDGVTSYRLGAAVPWYAMYKSGAISVSDADVVWEEGFRPESPSGDGSDSPENRFGEEANEPDSETDGQVQTTAQKLNQPLTTVRATGLRTLGGAAAKPTATWDTTPPDSSKWKGLKLTLAQNVKKVKITPAGEIKVRNPKMNINLGISCSAGWAKFPSCSTNPTISAGIEFHETLSLDIEKADDPNPWRARPYLVRPFRVATFPIGGIPFTVALSVPAIMAFPSTAALKVGFKQEAWGDPSVSLLKRGDAWKKTINIQKRIRNKISQTGTGTTPDIGMDFEAGLELTIAPSFLPPGDGIMVRVGPKLSLKYSLSCASEIAVNVGGQVTAGFNGVYFDGKIDLSQFSFGVNFPIKALTTTFGKSCSEEPVSCTGKKDFSEHCTGPYGSLYSCLSGKVLDQPRKCGNECIAIEGKTSVCRK
jgi:hypothetical protein